MFMTTRRIFCAAVLTAAVIGGGAAQGAIIQSGPVAATFAGDLPYDPTGPSGTLQFNAALGTLNTATLTFSGSFLGTFGTSDTDPSTPPPATLPATTTVPYQLAGNISADQASFSFVAPLTSVSGPQVEYAFTEPANFDLVIPGADYGNGYLYSDWRFDISGTDLVGASGNSDIFFVGTILATFDYTPAAVPEPASLALLGIGLAGLLVVRRRSATTLTHDVG